MGHPSGNDQWMSGLSSLKPGKIVLIEDVDLRLISVKEVNLECR